MKKATKIDYTGLDPSIELEAAESYVEHRINKGKPLTQRAFNQAMGQAMQAHEVGMTPTQLIDWTVGVKGWDGINLAYTKSALSREMQAVCAVSMRREINPGQPLISDDTKTKSVPIAHQLGNTDWAK